MQTPRDEWAGQSAFGDVVVSRWLQDPCIPNTDTQREVKVSISLKTPYLLPQVEIKDMNVHRDSIKSVGGGEQYSTDDYKASETSGKLYYMCKEEQNALRSLKRLL